MSSRVYRYTLSQLRAIKQNEIDALQAKYDSLKASYKALKSDYNEQSQHMNILKAHNKKMSQKQVACEETLESAMNKLKKLEAKHDQMRPDYDRLKALESVYDKQKDLWKKVDRMHSKNEQKINKLEQENETLRQQVIDWKTKCNKLDEIRKSMEAPMTEHNQETDEQKISVVDQENEAAKGEEDKLLKKKTAQNALPSLFEMKCTKERDHYKQQIIEMKQQYRGFMLGFQRLRQNNKELMTENEALYKRTQ